MSKRPRIKQADGSLLDLPLDAETIQGKKLEEIALKTDIPTKTSELTNDSNFLTKHQDISGKADKTELDNYLPYTTGTADNAKNIHWTTRLNSFQFDIESTKPSIEFFGDRVGSATITPNKIELNGNSESGTASILLDGKQVALQENIPTKISQLEQDVELGVKEEDVMDIVDKNSQEVNSYSIGTSENYDTENDTQIPTTKAVKDIVDNNVPTNVVTKDEDGVAEINEICNISSLDSRNKKSGIIFNNVGYEVLLYSEEAKIGLATPDMIDGGDIEHFIHFPDTGRTNGNGTLNSYNWHLPEYGGTILTDSMPIYTNENITTYKNLVVYSDDDSDSELQPKNNDDIDATYYSKGILLFNNDTEEEHRLYYPEKTGTLALLEDLENIGGGSGSTKLKLVATGTHEQVIQDRCNYILDNELEENKLYLVTRYNEEYEDTSSTVTCVGTQSVISIRETSDDTMRQGNLTLTKNLIILDAIYGFYQGDSDKVYVYEIQGGSSTSSGSSGSSIELVATGTIEKTDSDMLVIRGVQLTEKTQYILRLYNSPYGGWNQINFTYIDESESYKAIIVDSDEENQIINFYVYDNSIYLGGRTDNTFIYENGDAFELYEVKGGSSAGAKLKKKDYIHRINSREGLLNGYTDGEFEVPHTLALFNEPVDIVVEQPRSRRPKHTPTQPSLYRPLGGQRRFTNINTLTLKDIFLDIFDNFTENEIDTIISTGVDISKRSLQNGHKRYILFTCDKYSLENILSNSIFDYAQHKNYYVERQFIRQERWNSKLFRFFYKPVKNYEIKYDYEGRPRHYTYLTGSYGIEIGIKLSYSDILDDNSDKLKILLIYQKVKIE